MRLVRRTRPVPELHQRRVESRDLEEARNESAAGSCRQEDHPEERRPASDAQTQSRARRLERGDERRAHSEFGFRRLRSRFRFRDGRAGRRGRLPLPDEADQHTRTVT